MSDGVTKAAEELRVLRAAFCPKRPSFDVRDNGENPMVWDATNVVGIVLAAFMAVAAACMLIAQTIVPLRRFALRLLYTVTALILLHALLIVGVKLLTGNGNYMRVFR